MASGLQCWFGTRSTTKCATWASGSPSLGLVPPLHVHGLIPRTTQIPLESILRGRRHGTCSSTSDSFSRSQCHEVLREGPSPTMTNPSCNYESRGLLWFPGMRVSVSSFVIGPGVVGSRSRHSEMDSAHSWVNHKGNYTGTWLIRAIQSFFNFTKSKNREYGLLY